MVLCVIASWCLMMTAPSMWAETPQDHEPTDWPVMIARLRQEWQQHPGLANTRAQLAIAYNNYGVSLSDQNDWISAARQFEEAIRLDPTNEQFKTNFGHSLLNQAQDAYQHYDLVGATATLQKALQLNPKLDNAYALLGEIEYNRQHLKEAKSAWEKALQLNPQLPRVQDRLMQVTGELPVESKFERVSQAYFDVRFEEGIDRPTGFDVRDALVEARRQVGSDFNYWPKHQVIVLVYSADSFRALRQQVPDWVAGQFDGKIRVPLPGAQLNLVDVRQTLFHEYTHAVIYDLTNGACPEWINEGLAEYEGRSQRAGAVRLLREAAEQQRLYPWGELGQHITNGTSADEVGLGYEQSYSIIAYVVNRYGFWRVRNLLKRFAAGESWESALPAELHTKGSSLQTAWRNWLSEFLATYPSS